MWSLRILVRSPIYKRSLVLYSLCYRSQCKIDLAELDSAKLALFIRLQSWISF